MKWPFAFVVVLILAMWLGVSAAGHTKGRAVPQLTSGFKNGDYVWNPEISPAGPVVIIVSLPGQRMYVYRNGVRIGVSTVSTGTKSHATPTGVFTILQKKVSHESNLYKGARMPNMQRLTWTGIALHAGHLPGYPASHGCIRLPMKFSTLLFEATKLGMTVIITSAPALPQESGTPDVAEDDGKAGPSLAKAPFVWRPERSREGIV